MNTQELLKKFEDERGLKIGVEEYHIWLWRELPDIYHRDEREIVRHVDDFRRFAGLSELELRSFFEGRIVKAYQPEKAEHNFWLEQELRFMKIGAMWAQALEQLACNNRQDQAL